MIILRRSFAVSVANRLAHCFLGALICLLLSGLGVGQVLIPTPENFETERLQAIALGEAGDWEEAHGAWMALIRQHAGKDYVRSKLPDIREAVKRSKFWSGRKRPKPADLVSGSLKKYSRSSGKVRILYTAGQTGDFIKDGEFMEHPMLFRKSYFVELEAKPAVLAKQTIIVDFDGESGYLVGAGDKVEGSNMWFQHHLVRFARSKQEVIEKVDPKVRKSKDGDRMAKLRVMVDGSKITVRYNGRKVLSTRRKSGSLGRVAFLTEGAFTKLTIDGTAEVSWLEGLVDDHVQGELKAFEAAYKHPAEFDVWGVAVATTKSPRDIESLLKLLDLPGKHTQHQIRRINRVMGLLNEGKTKECREVLATYNPLECTAPVREMFGVLIGLQDHEYGQVLKHIEAFRQVATPDLALKTLEVVLMGQVERLSDAQAKLELLVVEEPNDTAFHAELASVLMLQGHLKEARQRVDKGLAIAPGDEELLNTLSQLTKATQGPSWRKSHREETDHFVVVSNMNKKGTRVIARAAEQALTQYVARFGPLPDAQNKLPLYLFSGSSGYMAYIEGVADGTGESTLGLFSPLLKQVLVWNQSDRKGMIRTVRHEVMHAYMDRVLGFSPTWLGEGLSEYCAEAQDEKGEWREGGPGLGHLRTLKDMGLRKLKVKDLLYMNHEDFMRNAHYTYPMSWALVDFLLSTTPENRALMDSMWETLKGEIGNTEATHRVFDSVPLGKLGRAFWKHVNARFKEHGIQR